MEAVQQHEWENAYNKVTAKCIHCECVKIGGMYMGKDGNEYLEQPPPCITRYPEPPCVTRIIN